MNFKPLSNHVFLEPLEESKTTKSGIVIPDTADKEKPMRGKVLAIGPGKLNDKGERVTMSVKVGDVVSLGKKAQEMALVIEAQSLPEREIPDYVAPDGNDKVTFTRVPKLDEVPYPVTMEPNLVVEFYSR